MLKLFTIPLVIAMLANLAEVNFAQLGGQISENYALIMENAETSPKPPPNQNSQGNQNNQGGNSQGGGGRGGSGGHSQPPVEPDETFTVEYFVVGHAPFGFSYPPITLVESRQELEAYYNENNYPSGSSSDGTPYGTLEFGSFSFRDAMDSYDDAYFAENVLLIVAHGVPSISIWPEVERVDFVNAVVHVRRWVPFGQIDGTARYHFLIGFPKKNLQNRDFTVSLTETPFND
jgi:hypothetical protein